MKKFPIAKPFIGKEEERAVLKVLRSGHLSLGPVYSEFEKQFAKKIGTKYACSVSSGTAGLHLAMLACGIGPGDEVITSPFSFVASANSILYVGAKPVFIDIDPVTYNMNPANIESKITKKTKAILVVHIFGQPTNMDQVMKLAKKYKLRVIEDACESILSTYKHKKAGTFGDVGVFAFYPNKQMTSGEGGMIVTNNSKIYKICDSLKNQGRAEDDQWLDHKYLGYNYRLDEMSAAVGLVQLKKIDKMIVERRKIAEWYGEILKPFSEILQAPEIGKENTHTWFVYVVKIKNKKIKRNQLITELKKVGIGTKPYLPSIHLFEFYRKMFGYKRGNFPISEEVSDFSIALPIYIGLKRKDCEYIIHTIVNEIEKLSKHR